MPGNPSMHYQQWYQEQLCGVHSIATLLFLMFENASMSVPYFVLTCLPHILISPYVHFVLTNYYSVFGIKVIKEINEL